MFNRKRKLIVPARILFERGTGLDSMVTIVNTEVADGIMPIDHNLRKTVVQNELKQLCPDYNPSRLVILKVSVGGVMCRSGENSGGRPYRDECCRCLVGQFAVSTGAFLGIAEA